VSRLVSFIHAHPLWSWAGLVAYAAAVTFPHENVQWVVNELSIRYTHKNVQGGSAAIALLEVLVLTALVFRKLAGQPQRRLVTGLWILTLALICGAWRAFTANNLELVHYPQYFPEGLALTALTLSPAEALSWIVLFGGLDEGYQFWVLAKGRPTLFDFNDIYMDLLGGAAGVIFAMAFLHCVRKAPVPGQWMRTLRRPGVVVLLSVIVLGVLLWASGLMLIVQDKTNLHYWFDLGRFQAPSFWSKIAPNGPNKYHTLTPVEGVGLILATIALYAAFVRKYAIVAD
jgi:hypothetical protein